MYSLADFRDGLARLTQILSDCGVRFLLTGGVAAIAYGDPRTTQDVDLVVEHGSLTTHLPQFLERIADARFLFHEPAIREAISRGRQFQLFDIASSLKLDLYPRELVAGELERSVKIEIFPGVLYPVASRPDLVASKLVWISLGSHKSRRDVRQILLRATVDELRLVEELASRFDLLALLNEIRNEPDEIDL